MKLAPAYFVADRAANKGWLTASVALLAVLALGVLMAFPMPALAAPDVPLLTSRSTPKGASNCAWSSSTANCASRPAC